MLASGRISNWKRKEIYDLERISWFDSSFCHSILGLTKSGFIAVLFLNIVYDEGELDMKVKKKDLEYEIDRIIWRVDSIRDRQLKDSEILISILNQMKEMNKRLERMEQDKK